MRLFDSIVQILREAGKPLSILEITERLNQVELYIQKDRKQIEREQVHLCVRNYSKIFDNINGYVILTSDGRWKNLLTTYWYLADTLRNYFDKSDLQFMLASLLFLKRVYDMSVSYQGYRIQIPIHKFPNSLFGTHSIYTENIIQDAENLDEQNKSPNIFSDNSQLLKRLDKETRFEIFNVLNRFDTTEYTEEEFGPIFEYFLHHISVESSNSTTPFTPKYLQKLMVTLLAPSLGRKLYDPVCGSGGLLVEALRLVKGESIAKGTEINHRMAQFGYMNLVMNGFFDVDLEAVDFLEEFHTFNSYDYIIGDLPLNREYKPVEYYDLFHKWGIQPPKSGKGYSAPVIFVLSKMANKGRAVITVSETLLFKGGKEKEIRELLIIEDVLECVISLPNGALRPYTNAKSSILVLNRNKPSELQGKIKFIESAVTYSDSKSMDINTDEIISLYQSNSQESASNYKLIEGRKLTEDLNLSVSSYSTESLLTEEMLLLGNAVKLGELVDISSGINPKKGDSELAQTVPIIKIENLSRDILDLYLNCDTINHKVSYNPQYKRSLLSEECILVARIGDQLKPTYFKPSEEILFHNGLFALKPKKKGAAVDLEYLYYQLYDEFVLDQIQRSRTGSVMPSISIARLKETVIPYMDIHAQKDFIASQKARIIASERAKVEERIKALDYEETIEQKESDIIKTLVHQLRPTLTSIDLQVMAFKRIVAKYDLTGKREFEDDYSDHDPEIDGLINKPQNNTLGELINRFELDTLHLSDVLTSVNKVMNFNLNPIDKKETDILKFIQDFADQQQQKKSREYTIEVKGEHVILLIHHPSFRDLLDQLILNAEAHGFSDKESMKKIPRIIFRIRKNERRQVAIIEYQNNGKPFKLSQKEYVKAFSKSQNSQGSGIGGNYVNRIISAHGGALEIDENLDSGFRMILEIPLHDDKINYE